MNNNNNNNNNPKSTAIVKFNVGGTHYDVSRSLLDLYPNTMLSRMVSDTWMNVEGDNAVVGQEGQEALFIERDGGRFKFVLDFMRDGKVSLPIGCPASKESLLADLAYFGFEGASADSVSISKGGIWESEDLIRDLESSPQRTKIAYLCYKHFKEGNYEARRKTFCKNCATKEEQGLYDEVAFLVSQGKRGVAKINDYLARFGFKCESMSKFTNGHAINFTKLD